MSLFDETIATEVESLCKLSLKSVNADGTLRANKESVVIECLALSRDALRRLDVDYKALTKPIDDQLHPFTQERNVYKAALEKVETVAKTALLAELAETHALPEESANGVRLSIVAKPKLHITDAAKIPDTFLLPREKCIDTAALTEHLKKARALNKALVEAGGKPNDKLKTPGAELVDEFILSTRLPEIVA